jgi:mannose/cellobiose epimerase-like protein (N-acyl-D-glucosamine 2-epimerase family)
VTSWGALTTVEHLSQRLLQRWVPKWYDAFEDTERGGFHERLGEHFKPIDMGYKRLLTQCRQLAMYSDAATRIKFFRPELDHAFEYIVARFYVPETGGFIFSIDNDGKILGDHYDLYAQTFVIFAFSHCYRATGNILALEFACSTLDFIVNKFKLTDAPGYAEALDAQLNIMPQTRRQNPHMHLLEACLFAVNTWPQENAFLSVADEMVALFKNYFFMPDKNWLCEFFTYDLKPDPTEGSHVEAGHYGEWVWLLKKHACAHNQEDMHDDDCRVLVEFANQYGWDEEFGGIYDVITPTGEIIKDTKRLWPFAEILKANALVLNLYKDKDSLKDRMALMVKTFREDYIHERGFWTEWLNRDLTPVVDYMPGTTPYHVYFGIMESLDVLSGRGRSKSWRAAPLRFAYTARRHLSQTMKKTKLLIRR